MPGRIRGGKMIDFPENLTTPGQHVPDPQLSVCFALATAPILAVVF